MIISKNHSILIDAESQRRVALECFGDDLYRGPTGMVSASNNDGVIEDGESFSFTEPTWFLSAGQTVIRESNPPNTGRRYALRTITDIAYTVQPTDENFVLFTQPPQLEPEPEELDPQMAVLTIANDSKVSLPEGTWFGVMKNRTSNLEVHAGEGVTIHYQEDDLDEKELLPEYTIYGFFKIAGNEWGAEAPSKF